MSDINDVRKDGGINADSGREDMAERSVELSILLDFYGDVLSDRQREAVRLWCDEDLSLSEISSVCGITRAGVRDRILKSEAILRVLEDKLGLVRRFSDRDHTVRRIIARLESISGEDVSDIISDAKSLLI
ncbi:MAG: sigma factor-like helix-turn-helix DNA-binding protein [Eubacteriales bacterium]